MLEHAHTITGVLLCLLVDFFIVETIELVTGCLHPRPRLQEASEHPERPREADYQSILFGSP
jgi:hypothetical protein